jgi:hypothetical protein
MPIVLYTVPVTFNEGKALPPTFNRVVTRSDDGGICHLSNMLDEASADRPLFDDGTIATSAKFTARW